MNKRTFAATLVFVALSTLNALAGPPLICHPIAIGDARSLPWSDSPAWNGMLTSYDTAHLVNDTLALLSAQTPVEVRMETLRRAAIYTSRDPRLASELLSRLLQRTRGMNVQANALFDAGYFAEAVNEAAEAYAMIHDPAQRAAWKLTSAPF